MKTPLLPIKSTAFIVQKLCFCLVITMLSSCDSFLDITPTGKIIAKTGAEYRALLTYEYKYFPSDLALTTLRSDELSMAPSYTSNLDYDTYFDLWRWNDDTPATTTTYFNWRGYYHTIYIANYIIEHKDEITDATQAEIDQLVGESYMLRAYCHFLLCNLYAEPYTNCDPAKTRGIPLMTKADVNAMPRSSSVEAVYKQVMNDIDEAEKYLNVEIWETGLNYRFNAISAQCLRARAALYMGDWQTALTASQAVIEARPELEDLSAGSATLPSYYASKENIMSLNKVMTAQTITIGKPSPEFIKQYRSGDQRRTTFFRRVTSSVYNLLKGGNEFYNCTFHSSEFYLTAAEAAISMNNRETAMNYMTALMQKRYNTSAYDTYLSELEAMHNKTLKTEILNERCRELAFEGHRWFDLRRTDMPAISKTYESNNYSLEEGDRRYTLRFPPEAVEANPEIEIWSLP